MPPIVVEEKVGKVRGGVSIAGRIHGRHEIIVDVVITTEHHKCKRFCKVFSEVFWFHHYSKLV